MDYLNIKSINDALRSFDDVTDPIRLPSGWPDEFKELFRATVNKSSIADKERDYLHHRGEKFDIDAEEIDIYIDRTLEQHAEIEREDREMDAMTVEDEFPPELKKYTSILEALEEENYAGIAIKAAKLFAPMLLICLAIIVVCFIIKWWLGLMAILGVVIYLGIKGYALFQKFQKYF